MGNTAHSESKDVMTKARSFVPREMSEDQLELSTLTREAAVQEVGSSFPTTMQGTPVPRVTEINRWILGVGPADSSVLDPRLRSRREEEVQGAWLSQHGQSLYLAHLSPPEIIPAKSRGSYTDQKCWCQGFYKVPAVNTIKERG